MFNRDYTNHTGAQDIADTITKYWAAQGLAVEIKLEEASFHSSLRRARVDVRSDMKNGWPIRALPSSERRAA